MVNFAAAIKRWRLSFAVILEFIAGFVCLTLLIGTVNHTTTMVRRANAIAPLPTRNLGLFQCKPEKVENALDQLRRDHQVALFYYTGELDEFTGVSIDEPTAKLFERRVTGGRWLLTSDFQTGDDYLPVVLGADAYPELGIGDQIPDADQIVVGRLAPSQLFWSANRGGLDAIVETDSLIISPLKWDNTFSTGSMMVLPEGDRSVALSQVPDELSQCLSGMDTLGTEVAAYYRSKRPVLLLSGFLAVTVLGVAFLGYAAIGMITVERRIREFAIRLAVGATKIDLARSLATEMIIMCTVAASVGLPVGIMLAKTVHVPVTAVDMIWVVGTGVVIGLLTSVAPILSVLRRPPVYFIRNGR